jgi:hypothetical protein
MKEILLQKLTAFDSLFNTTHSHIHIEIIIIIIIIIIINFFSAPQRPNGPNRLWPPYSLLHNGYRGLSPRV